MSFPCHAKWFPKYKSTWILRGDTLTPACDIDMSTRRHSSITPLRCAVLRSNFPSQDKTRQAINHQQQQQQQQDDCTSIAQVVSNSSTIFYLMLQVAQLSVMPHESRVLATGQWAASGGGVTMMPAVASASAAAAAASHPNNNTRLLVPPTNESSSSSASLWHVGQVVHVKARTWPG
jgi:hypothetical protein